MSARITVIVYILICLEVGILLILLPWTPYWSDNFFFDVLRSKFNAPWLAAALQSGFMRGAVTGLGVLNILAGLRDAFRFKDSVRTLTDWEVTPSEDAVASKSAAITPDSGAAASTATSSADLSDHQSPRIPPSS